MKNQTMIVVQDVIASSLWYCRLFGLKSGHGGDEYDQLLYEGELVLQLHGPEPDAHHESLIDKEKPRGNGIALWFESERFEEIVKTLKELHIPLEKEPTVNPFARHTEVWLRDPDGYLIVITSPSPYKKKPLTHE